MNTGPRDESGGTSRRGTRGRLHVYLGAAPGVGKTYAMLDEGLRLAEDGVDVLVAVVETHHRPDLLAKAGGLEVVPPRRMSYRGASLEEMDLDTLLARRPAVVLVDELAHSDVPGCRFEKRWQDVEELLDAGIDVITNLNIQHLECLNDAVEAVTGVTQHETVPDTVVASADRIELLDVSPNVLRARIVKGSVFEHGGAESALTGYFSSKNLAALRELALGKLSTNHVLALGPSRGCLTPNASSPADAK